jgi:hypothetical protein
MSMNNWIWRVIQFIVALSIIEAFLGTLTDINIRTLLSAWLFMFALGGLLILIFRRK